LRDGSIPRLSGSPISDDDLRSNLIHQPTRIKNDLFVAGGSPIDEQQLEGRQRIQVKADPSRSTFITEDVLL